MANNSQDGAGDTEFIKTTTLYREFQAEREEILRHKWFESEKAGYDIGFERDKPITPFGSLASSPCA